MEHFEDTLINDASEVSIQLMAMGFKERQVNDALVLTKSTDTQTLIDAILAQVDFEAMEEANFEASSSLLLPNEFLIEAPELIQNNLSNENFRYSHRNSSLVQDTTVSKSKERSPESQKQHKSSKIVDNHFFSKDRCKQKYGVMVAVTGAAGVGALSILLLKKNATNVFPNTRMGILGASILGVAIPLWIVRKWVAGNNVIADFKVRLYKNTDNYVEGTHVSAQMIRINCDRKLLFSKLEQSLMQKFEQLHQPNTLVTIFWQEREENWIDISDQDALCNAMEKMGGPVYKLNVAFQTK